MNQRPSILQKRMKSNLSLKLLTPLKIIKTIYNCKSHLHLEMMPFIWELCTWDLQRVSQPELYLILVLNIWPLLLHFATTKPQEILSSRSTIPFQVLLSRETNWMKDARLKLMTWKSQIPTRFFLKHLPSWPTALLNCKGSFGKIMPASSHSKEIPPNWQSWKCNWKITSVLTSNSWLYTNLKALVRIQMVSLDFPLTRTWAKRSCTTSGQWKTME